ncbi:gas vesicle protein GvpO [Streptomyces sp. NRRL B-24484]|uniref:gas vesicle protein GvpO n=1 Tax=Streptomyces sp. NRRL B-24484 TaxID=1463833 RepID=UPI000996360F|nr:gas vesicle protein GvpO [Streptomyces sp. NRRL B-24484]
MAVRTPRPADGGDPDRPVERRPRRTPPAEPPPDRPVRDDRPERRTRRSATGPDAAEKSPARRRTAGEPTRPVRRRSDGTPDRSPDPARSAEGPPRRRPSDGRLTARRAAAVAAADVGDLTGRTPEGITSIDRTDDGWRIGVEVMESRRVPDSTDILAVYLVALDDDGDLVSYRRERRYYRGRPEEDSP